MGFCLALMQGFFPSYTVRAYFEPSLVETWGIISLWDDDESLTPLWSNCLHLEMKHCLFGLQKCSEILGYHGDPCLLLVEGVCLGLPWGKVEYLRFCSWEAAMCMPSSVDMVDAMPSWKVAFSFLSFLGRWRRSDSLFLTKRMVCNTHALNGKLGCPFGQMSPFLMWFW